MEKLPQKRMECFKLLLEHLAWMEHQFLSGIRYSRKAGSLWGMMRGVGGVRKSIHQSWLAKGVRVRLTTLRFWGSSGRDSVGRGQHSSNRVSGISTRTMHQSLTVLVQTLLLVIFGYSLSSRKTLEAVIMRQLRRWKRLWRRSLIRSHKRTSMGPSRRCWNGTTSALQPEDITLKGTRVLCVYYQ